MQDQSPSDRPSSCGEERGSREGQDSPWLFVLWGSLFESALLLLALLLGWIFDSPVLDRLSWGWGAFWLGVAASLPPSLAFLLLVRSPRSPVRRLVQDVESLLGSLLGCPWPAILLLSLLAGVGEEALFRGFLQGLLQEVWGEREGLLAASFLFGLAHFLSPLYLLLATLMGGYLGWLFLSSGSLLVPVVVHSLYDFTALLYFRSRLERGGSSGSRH